MTGVSPAVLHNLGGAGPPVLLVHGFGADSYGWAANAHALMATRTVWAVDLPGHGRAGNEVGDGSPVVLAAAVAGSIGDLAAPMPVIAHSLGAAVALHLAHAVPDLFNRMVLIAPAIPGANIDSEFLARFPTLCTRAEAEALLVRLVVRQNFVAPMAAHVLASVVDPQRRAALQRIAMALSAAALPSTPPKNCPVTVIWGDTDRIATLPTDLALGVEPVIIPGVGHLPHIEAAGAVNRLLVAALT